MPKRIVINVEEVSLIEDLNTLLPDKKKQGVFLQKLIREHLLQHQEKILELKNLERLRKEITQNGNSITKKQ